MFLTFFLCPAEVVKFLTSPNAWVGILSIVWEHDCLLKKAHQLLNSMHGFPSWKLPSLILAVFFSQLWKKSFSETHMISLENHQFFWFFVAFIRALMNYAPHLCPNIWTYLSHDIIELRTARVISYSSALTIFYSVFILLSRKWSTSLKIQCVRQGAQNAFSWSSLHKYISRNLMVILL